LISFAVVASQICANLCADTNSIANFDVFDGLADLNCSSNYLVSNADWERDFTPAASDSVDIATANSAGVDGDVNVMIFEWLEFELEKENY
jgi:hypothetical protein